MDVMLEIDSVTAQNTLSCLSMSTVMMLFTSGADSSSLGDVSFDLLFFLSSSFVSFFFFPVSAQALSNFEKTRYYKVVLVLALHFADIQSYQVLAKFLIRNTIKIRSKRKHISTFQSSFPEKSLSISVIKSKIMMPMQLRIAIENLSSAPMASPLPVVWMYTENRSMLFGSLNF